MSFAKHATTQHTECENLHVVAAEQALVLNVLVFPQLVLLPALASLILATWAWTTFIFPDCIVLEEALVSTMRKKIQTLTYKIIWNNGKNPLWWKGCFVLQIGIKAHWKITFQALPSVQRTFSCANHRFAVFPNCPMDRINFFCCFSNTTCKNPSFDILKTHDDTLIFWWILEKTLHTTKHWSRYNQNQDTKPKNWIQR